jgi:hypothetical protein
VVRKQANVKETGKIKTTVTIPITVLEGLQRYIAKTPNLTLRDQSTVVVTALLDFLDKNDIKIDRTDSRVKNFLVSEELEGEL